MTIVAPITDEAQYKGYPQQVKVTAAELAAIGVTAKDSIVECGHLRSIDGAARIKENRGPMDPAVLLRIDAAVKKSPGM